MGLISGQTMGDPSGQSVADPCRWPSHLLAASGECGIIVLGTRHGTPSVLSYARVPSASLTFVDGQHV